MAIITVAIAIATLDVSTTTNALATVANLTNKLSQVYFVQEQGEILDTISQYNEDTKSQLKILEEMKKDTLYIPLDSYDRYYTLQYDMLYNSYDSMYDYDKMFNTNIGVTL